MVYGNEKGSSKNCKNRETFLNYIGRSMIKFLQGIKCLLVRT